MRNGHRVLLLLATHLLMLTLPLRCLHSSGIREETRGQAGVGAAGNDSRPVSMTDSRSPHSPAVIMVAHFLQSLTHRLVLGGELVYHRRPGEEGAILTLAGKYSGMG